MMRENLSSTSEQSSAPEFLRHGPVAIYFPGQGYQFTGMGKPEYDAYEFVRKMHEVANDALGYSITDIMHNPERQADLLSPRYCQPAILLDTIGKLAVATHYYPQLVQPEAFGGLSFGEFPALVAAGAVDPIDMLRIVDARGVSMQRIMEKQDGGNGSGVLKIQLRVDRTGLIKDQRLHFARGARELRNAGLQFGYFYNEETIGMGGTFEQIGQGLEAMREFEQYGVKTERLDVPIAFHTSHVADVAADIREAIENVVINQPHTPVMMNRTARLTTDPNIIRDEIPQHADNAVNLVGALRRLRKRNLVGSLVEIGSRPIITVLTKGPEDRRIPVKTPDREITVGFALVPEECVTE